MIDRNLFSLFLALPFMVGVLNLFSPKAIKATLNYGAILILTVICGLLFSTSSQKLVILVFGYEISFIADGFAFIMALVVLAVSSFIAIYSSGYMSHYKKLNEFYFFYLIFVGCMLTLIFSDNIILIYIMWEMTALCSWRLIGFYRGDQHTSAANKAFIITSVGAIAMLVGIVMIYLEHGTFSLDALKQKEIAALPSLLIIAGMLSKSAQLPLHIWLPDAGVAPTPVTAMLHASVLVKIGVYAFFRFFGMNMLLTPQVQSAVINIALVTALAAAAAAVRENDIKRILAYSTISQVAYILFAFALNTKAGIIAGFIYAIVHAFGKAGLFLVGGTVEQLTGTKDINQLGGLKSVMPVSNAAYLLCAFSIVGLPPFGGFFGKFLVISAAVDSGRLFAAAALIFTAILSMYYIFRLYGVVFAGEQKFSVSKDGSAVMTYPALALGVISLIIGVFIRIPVGWLVLCNTNSCYSARAILERDKECGVQHILCDTQMTNDEVAARKGSCPSGMVIFGTFLRRSSFTMRSGIAHSSLLELPSNLTIQNNKYLCYRALKKILL